MFIRFKMIPSEMFDEAFPAEEKAKLTSMSGAVHVEDIIMCFPMDNTGEITTVHVARTDGANMVPGIIFVEEQFDSFFERLNGKKEKKERKVREKKIKKEKE